jgi:hypothetical protein
LLGSIYKKLFIDMRPITTLLESGHTGYGLLVEGDAGYISSNLTPNGSILSENTVLFKDGKYTINCILQKSNVLNRNGRIYPDKILRREVEKYREYIRNHNAGGECNHPNDITINVDNISHRVVDMWWEGDTLFGTLELMVSDFYTTTGQPTMVADRIAELLKKNYKLGISSRGVGSVKTLRGVHYVQDDFELVCFDIVSSPSTPNAYLFHGSQPKGMNESYTSIGIYTGSNAIISNSNPISEGVGAKLDIFLNKHKNLL